MNPLVVVIPSRTASNLAASIPAVRKHEPDARIIVVADGVDWDAFGRNAPTSSMSALFVAVGAKPFVFARNINIGIRAAGEDADVVCLNDDAILETPGGFSIMQAAAAQDERIGIIGAVTDLTGQPLQCRKRNENIETAARQNPGFGVRAVEHLAFVCVLLPARARRKLAEYTPQYPDLLTGGFLDERYCEGYGSEDADMCLQVNKITMLVCVHDGCHVNHSSLQSSFRGNPTNPGDIWPNHRILRKKWSMGVNPADPGRGLRV